MEIMRPTIEAMQNWVRQVDWPFGIEVSIAPEPWHGMPTGQIDPNRRVSAFIQVPVNLLVNGKPVPHKPWEDKTVLKGHHYFDWPDTLDEFKEHLFLIVITSLLHEVLEQMSFGGTRWLTPHIEGDAAASRALLLESFTTAYLGAHDPK